MIVSLQANSTAGFSPALYSCPACGRAGLQNKHAPCPACGGSVDVVHPEAGGVQAAYLERGETHRALADELEEERRRRLERGESAAEDTGHDRPPPHPPEGPGSAATAIEAAVDGHERSREQSQGGHPESPAASTTQQQSLDAEELQMLQDLQQRDREVRAHEQAHISAGGSVVSGGASYTYQTGPDGKQYAVGGEVAIDTSPVAGDPEATEEKAMAVRRAAMAPASPSGQDMQVAAQAAQMESEARMDTMGQEREEESGQHSQSLAPGESEQGAQSPPEQRLNPAAQTMIAHYQSQDTHYPQGSLPLHAQRRIDQLI